MTRIPPSERPRRLALLSDFGRGPYVGQIALLQSAYAPAVPFIELVSDLVAFRPDLSAFLLPGLMRGLPPGTLYLCVVDPGVGSDRGIIAVQRGDDWWLAPDNGLLVPLVRRLGPDARAWRVLWRPEAMSASFHGRDLFLPLAQKILGGALPGATPIDGSQLAGEGLPAQSMAVCYIDHYGNLMLGTAADSLHRSRALAAGDRRIPGARTFSDVAIGDAFWYPNAFGLVEIAVNQGRADNVLGLRPGDSVAFA